MPNIVLKDRDGDPVTFSPPVGVKLLGADGELIPLIPKDTAGGGDFYIIYMNEDGTETLYTRPIMYGDTAGDVIALGLMETPTKEAAELEEHTFLGWSTEIGGAVGTAMFENVTEDLTVYAAFKTDTLLARGECGATVSWKLNADGVLTVYGEGEMSNFGSASAQPWYSYQSSIKSVVLEDGVTSVGNYAFSNCTKMTSVTILGSLTRLGTDAFNNCSGLVATHITDMAAWCTKSMPASLGIYASPLYYSKNLYLNGTLVTDLVIPDTVTRISTVAFYGATCITSVTIPNSVTTIETNAFGYTGLKSVTIPETVTDIGARAFRNCTSLSSVTLNAPATMGIYVFQACSALASATIGALVTEIGYGAFSGCNNLKTATFKTTSGWWVSTSNTATSGTSVTVTNTSTAATYLRSTYVSYYWKRS